MRKKKSARIAARTTANKRRQDKRQELKRQRNRISVLSKKLEAQGSLSSTEEKELENLLERRKIRLARVNRKQEKRQERLARKKEPANVS